MEFTIKVTMKDRWVPHFLAMLRYMERLGRAGMSRRVTIFADGDGDFQPAFEWDSQLPEGVEPVSDSDGDRVYDAG